MGDARVRVLVGPGSPTEVKRPALYFDVTLPSAGKTELPIPADFQGFAYLLDGSGSFGSNSLDARQQQVVVFGRSAQPDGQTSFHVRAGASGLRFVVAAALPIGETPRWYGPYVD